MNIFIASNNEHKINEFKEMFSRIYLFCGECIRIITPKDLSPNTGKPIEDKETLEGNAYIKAKYYFDKTHMLTISDDTGLYVNSLNGEPGVHSARYAEADVFPNSDINKLNRIKLLNKLNVFDDRSAYFKCVICLIDPLGRTYYFTGETKGQISMKEDGDKGFGYDSIFYSDDLKMTFSKATLEEKSSVSHRGRAMKMLSSFLEKNDELFVLDKVNNVSQKVLGKDSVIKERLLGGMSNYTYVVQNEGRKYTVRIPGENSEYFTDRYEEELGLKIFKELKITNDTIYFENDGIKISSYIEGYSLNETNDRNYEEVSLLLKKVHRDDIKCDIIYNPFNRLERYENYIASCREELSFKKLFLDYDKVRTNFNKYKNYLESIKKVFCHNDSQPSNFIKTNDGLIIVDFEFIGYNDYLYDIACYGNIDFNDALKLFDIYESEKTNDKYQRLYLWRTFQCLQWFNVALFKHMIGLSEKLKLDFLSIAKFYLSSAKTFLSKSKEYE